MTMDQLTMSYFKEDTETFWESYWDRIDTFAGKEPNDGHAAIRKLQEFCAIQDSKTVKTKPKSLLVTQNVDHLHSDEVAKSKILNSVKKEAVEGGG